MALVGVKFNKPVAVRTASPHRTLFNSAPYTIALLDFVAEYVVLLNDESYALLNTELFKFI